MMLAYCSDCNPPAAIAIGAKFPKPPTHEVKDGAIHTAKTIEMDKAEKMTPSEIAKPQLYLDRMIKKYVVK